MKTSLEYMVCKEEQYDFEKKRTVNRITGRNYDFCVNGCDTKEEHDNIIDNFYVFLLENNVESYGFGDYTWEEAIRFDMKKAYSYLSIPVRDTEDKEYIKQLYNQWKQDRRQSVI